MDSLTFVTVLGHLAHEMGIWFSVEELELDDFRTLARIARSAETKSRARSPCAPTIGAGPDEAAQF